MARILLEVCVITLVLVFKECSASEISINSILHNHSPDLIPTSYTNDTVEVTVTLALVFLRDVDMERNEVEIVAWLGSQYNNPTMTWDVGDSDEYQITIDEWSIWKPDLVAYNGVNAPETTMSPPPRAILSRNGNVMYIRPLRFRFLCDLELVSSPDGTNCSLKIGSWVYNGFQMDLNGPSDVDLSNYFQNPKYEVVNAKAERNVLYYPCCVESYPDITYTFTIREKGAEKKPWAKWL